MKRIHAGFTLVELLVVITIIGILMGLLLPAVNAAREAARNNQCKTQLKNLSLAAIQYENSKGEFPGWIQDFGTYDPATGDPSDPDNSNLVAHKKLGTWVVSLLPYLEAQPTYEHWTQDKYPVMAGSGGGSDDNELTRNNFLANAAPNLAIMQCPSSTTMDGNYGRNSYVANNGMYHMLRTQSDNGRSQDAGIAPPLNQNSELAAFHDSMDRANGVFVNAYADNSGVNRGPKVSLDDLKDGHGNTVLFSENLQAVQWHRAGLINGSYLTSTSVAYPSSSRFSQGFVWHYEDPDPNTFANAQGVQNVHTINGTYAMGDKFNLEMEGANAPDVARPSSAHTGGVNMAFADGSTRFVTDGINYRVYQALMTPRGKSSDVPFSEFVPTGDEF